VKRRQDADVCLHLRLLKPTARPNPEVKAGDNHTVDKQLIVTLRKILFDRRNMVANVDRRQPQGDNILHLHRAIGLDSFPAQYTGMPAYLN
jgi:hypothetical protein